MENLFRYQVLVLGKDIPSVCALDYRQNTGKRACFCVFM